MMINKKLLLILGILFLLLGFCVGFLYGVDIGISHISKTCISELEKTTLELSNARFGLCDTKSLYDENTKLLEVEN